MSLLSDMSDMRPADAEPDKPDIRDKMEKYVDFMLKLVGLQQIWTDHATSCETCFNWVISDDNDLYRLKCGEGWINQQDLGLIRAKVDNPGQFRA